MKNKVKSEIVKAKNGFPTIKISYNGKEQYLHSKINPEKESSVFLRQITGRETQLMIVLGLGLGYHLANVPHNGSIIKKIIVFEFLEIDKRQPVVDSVKGLIDSGFIEIISGKNIDECEKLLSEKYDIMSYASISVQRHSASYRLFSGYYTALEKAIQSVINSKSSNSATIKKFAFRFFKNTLQHICFLNNTHSLLELKGCCKGLDIIIVSSSPTLSQFLREIKQSQQKFVILAVDSAVPVLCDFGIKCDFVISVDPQPWIIEHVLSYYDCIPALITNFTSHKHLQKVQTYYYRTTHPISQLLNELYPDKYPEITSLTGSVAGDAVAIASYLSPENIYLTGTDFCFAYNVIYSRGTAYQNRYDFFLRDRFNTKENQNEGYIRKSGVKGDRWYTRKNLIRYNKSVSEFIKQIDTTVVYLKKEDDEYGPKNCDYSTSLPKKKSGYLVNKNSLYSNNSQQPADSKNVLKLLSRDDIIDQLIIASNIPETKKTKLLTIINNLLISVEK